MRTSLAQATSTRLGESSHRNMDGLSGVFAHVRATRLGENTILQTCFHMQEPRFPTQFQSHPIL